MTKLALLGGNPSGRNLTHPGLKFILKILKPFRKSLKAVAGEEIMAILMDISQTNSHKSSPNFMMLFMASRA